MILQGHNTLILTFNVLLLLFLPTFVRTPTLLSPVFHTMPPLLLHPCLDSRRCARHLLGWQLVLETTPIPSPCPLVASKRLQVWKTREARRSTPIIFPLQTIAWVPEGILSMVPWGGLRTRLTSVMLISLLTLAMISFLQMPDVIRCLTWHIEAGPVLLLTGIADGISAT